LGGGDRKARAVLPPVHVVGLDPVESLALADVEARRHDVAQRLDHLLREAGALARGEDDLEAFERGDDLVGAAEMLRLLPAALSHGIGSDSQRPFAVVIVGGLIGVLVICIFRIPTLYVVSARQGDHLGDHAAE